MSNICPIDVQKVQIGNTVRATVTIRNIMDDYNPTDPDEVHFDILDPDGVEVTFQYGIGVAVQRASLGVYYIEYNVDKVGYWYFRGWSVRPDTSTEMPLSVIESRTYP